MENLEQIESFLLHEIGHVFIAITHSTYYPKIRIGQIVIRNFDCQNLSWCGMVKYSPEEEFDYDKILQDNRRISYNFISLFSGCLFQSLLNEEGFIQDCFAFKSQIGDMDYRNFWNLEHQIRSKFNYKLDKNQLHHNLRNIVQTNYQINLLKKKKFLKELLILIKEEAEVIYDDFLANKAPKKYYYIYKDKRLSELIEKINVLIVNNHFIIFIEGIVDSLERELNNLIFQS